MRTGTPPTCSSSSLSSSTPPTLLVVIESNNRHVKGVIDTASDITCAPVSEVDKWQLPWKRRSKVFKLADHSTFKTLGCIHVDCLIGDTRLKVPIHVVKSLAHDFIIGRDTINCLPVRMYYGQRLLLSGHVPPILAARSEPELQVGDGIRSFSPNSTENAAIKRLLLKHRNVVSQWCRTPGLIKDAAFRIPTGDAKPIFRKAIPMAAPHREYLQKHLADYTGRNMVRTSTSPWGAPTFLVPKAGTTEMRVCHDYRGLNKVTEPSCYPIPSTSQLQDIIGTKNRFYAKIDLRWGYNQIPIETADIPKTAITSPLGKHEWTVMGFGFRDAPLYFQQVIEQALGPDLLHKGAVVYLDDILIYASTFPEFLRILDLVLARLNAAGAKIQLGKSDFLPSELKYLGMVFTPQGVFHLPDRVVKLNSHPPPTTKKQLLSFLGFTNYFRNFIPDFTRHEAQLRSLDTRKFQYSAADKKSFLYLRSAVTKDTCLATFDAESHTEVHVDASGIGIGAILTQRQSSGVMRVVAFASRLLSPVEQRYSNTERELLAIKWAVCHRFRLQLLGRQFEVHTDHAALVNECKLKEPTSRIHRMLLKLDAFDCKIVHRAGKNNMGADFLSRIPASVDASLPTVASIRNDQADTASHQAIMQEYHVDGLKHLGFAKTLDAIARRFQWKGLRKDVQQFVTNCSTCQRFTKPVQAPFKPVQPIKSQSVKELLCLDFIGPLPSSSHKKYIIVAIDHFSKFVWAKPIAHPSSWACCQLVTSIFKSHGPWTAISTDNAQAFKSKDLESILSTNGIQHRFCSVSHPEGNGCVERFNRTLRQLLRKNACISSWSSAIESVISAYNAACHSATQAAPVEVFLDKPAILSPDAKFGVTPRKVRFARNLASYRESYTKSPDIWPIGSTLWHIPRLRSDKRLSASRHFDPQRYGPYVYVGPSPRPQYALLQKGSKTFSLPLWELQLTS